MGYLEGHMTVLENANAGDFDNVVKCTILKTMIETVENQQLAIQRLTQERYQLYDTPDTYEARIRPLLLKVADNDAQVLGFLKITPASQQQGHIISLEDMQKAIQNALVQQKTKNQTLVKKVTELESQMAKQTAPQTVKPVRQPRGPPSSLQTKKAFSKPYLEQIYSSNQSAKIDRIESKVDEISQMISQFGRIMLENQFKKSKADKPSDFAIKGNSKHISESLGWYTDMPISIKNKDSKIVTSNENFARINNSESEPMLCIGIT
ncbi:13075_t:CDS:2 [Cetraspora pellucida]|uniref:13075_t:CDS:1 n=1 Tax=Cetraspora pellucida TaxID=1433469 RepID=A0A9N9CLY3_9GLOM|nr:13075_t:CDS:2 [Cetraspora pellucida]